MLRDLYREVRSFFRKGDMVLLLLCVAALVSQTYNPFIYFQF